MFEIKRQHKNLLAVHSTYFSFYLTSVTASHDGNIVVWDNCRYSLLRVIKVHEGAIDCLVYDQNRIVTAGTDRLMFVCSICFYLGEFSLIDFVIKIFYVFAC